MTSIISITSRDNPRFKHVRQLLTHARARKKSGETVLEGIHLLESYQQKGGKPSALWFSDTALNHDDVVTVQSHWSDVPTVVLPDALYKELRTLGEGIDILAIIKQPVYSLTAIYQDALILNDVQDAGNVGTLLRTAAAVGIPHVLCTSGTASAWSPKCLRAGMGAQFSLNIYENLNASEVMTQVKVPLLATSSHTDSVIYEHNLQHPLAWVMGNEGQGVCDSLLDKSKAVMLPQPNGQESLNVAIAGALCMYEMLRQRHHA